MTFYYKTQKESLSCWKFYMAFMFPQVITSPPCPFSIYKKWKIPKFLEESVWFSHLTQDLPFFKYASLVNLDIYRTNIYWVLGKTASKRAPGDPDLPGLVLCVTPSPGVWTRLTNSLLTSTMNSKRDGTSFTKWGYRRTVASFLGVLFSLGLLTLRESGCPAVKSPVGQETQAANDHVSKRGRVSPPAPQQVTGWHCSPGPWFDYNSLRELNPGAPSSAALRFMIHRNEEVVNVLSFWIRAVFNATMETRIRVCYMSGVVLRAGTMAPNSIDKHLWP